LIVVMSLARIRLLIVAVALLSAAVSVPAFSQKFGPDRAPNLTTSVIDERTLVMQVPRIEERVDIPDTTAGVLIEPAGRTWNCFHEVPAASGRRDLASRHDRSAGRRLPDHRTDLDFRRSIGQKILSPSTSTGRRTSRLWAVQQIAENER
jgi:hypothetical protein